MGRLVEQTVATQYQGVSRQPQSVRLPGQVESADNAWFGVESGGFSKRPGSDLFASRPSGFGGQSLWTHSYQRDANEKYLIVVSQDGATHVIDKDGGFPQVTVTSAAQTYMANNDGSGFAFVTVGDYTLIANRSQYVAMDSALSAGSGMPEFGDRELAIIHVAASDPNYASFEVTLANANGTNTATFVATEPASGQEFDTFRDQASTKNVASSLASQLEGLSGTSILNYGSFIGIASDNQFELSAVDYLGDTAIKIAKGTVGALSDLPAVAYPDQILAVGGQPGEDTGYYVKFHVRTQSGLIFLTDHLSEGTWEEAIAPRTPYKIDAQTMPVGLVRQVDGTFLLDVIGWGDRQVGDETSIPDPEFIGRKIQDLSFHRDRLVILAGETVSYSRAGDYFSFWPEKIAAVLDSDPFSRVAATSSVNQLLHAVPFRRTLFATADLAQFEVSSYEAFTPTTASIDVTTTYEIERTCAPAAIGNEIYFAAARNNDAAILEYYYSEKSVGGTADEVTTHCSGYIPAPVTRLVGHSTTGIVFAFSPTDPRALYVYRRFWNGQEKAQSAWGRWAFEGEIRGLEVLTDELYVILGADWAGGVVVLRYPLNMRSGTEQKFGHCLDSRVYVQATYNAGTNRTSWPKSLLPSDSLSSVEIYYNDEGADGPGTQIPTYKLTEDGPNYTVKGDWTDHRLVVGRPYTMDVALSTIYLYEGESAITSGRLQLRKLWLTFKDTARFMVRLLSDQRPAREREFVSRRTGTTTLGSSAPLTSGVHEVRIGGRNDATSIHIVNDTVYPSTFAGFRWTGFFNDISRQG